LLDGDLEYFGIYSGSFLDVSLLDTKSDGLSL